MSARVRVGVRVRARVRGLGYGLGLHPSDVGAAPVARDEGQREE